MEKIRSKFNCRSHSAREAILFMDGQFIHRMAFDNTRAVDLYHINGLIIEAVYNFVDHRMEKVYAPSYKGLDKFLPILKIQWAV